ncbi:MAG: hypothetical protein GWN00_24260 [Aliifodinibius sp.]|nr:nuclear transport factor 2 family protein [candidate division Zixibacteria bacterium]NIT59219.1 nuclear transport factor 2 family protein [Fodinibius sp.]NIW40480.1 hypothetical protein [candidate division Zixibacteria bacterium]NIX57803.1 hypothetical protein [candidate division Zixibacteria bacterium]NIY27802.1 hypothetical protein [Fodinibius sp.]
MTDLKEYDYSEDEIEISKMFQQFFEGIKNLNADQILKIFYPKADSYSITPNGVCIEPTSNWTNIIEDAKADPKHIFNELVTAQIVSIDIAGTAASVKTKWIFKSCEIIDFYNLININDKWLIVNQVYHSFA